MAQLASLELHPSLSLAESPDSPTVLVFDLDPGPPAGLVECCAIAVRLREIFDHFGLRAFAKTSGSKGLQVYLPLNSGATYEETKPLAGAIARLLEKQTPEAVVAKMGKKTERSGRVLVDWYQNHPRKTTIAVYSLRARERPTVSTPLTWEEVESAARTGDPAPSSSRRPRFCAGSRALATSSARSPSFARSCPTSAPPSGSPSPAFHPT